MRSVSFLRAGAACVALSSGLSAALALAPSSVSASGPVERLLQVLRNPNDPNELVLRYGVASEGFLFSRDGGHSFRALCTGALGLDNNQRPLGSITVAGRNYKPPALMDGKGRLLVTNFDQMWIDDGTGCNWTDESAALQGNWIISTALEPKTQALLAIANVQVIDGDNITARAEVRRRKEDGSFEVLGNLMPPGPDTRTYGDDLLAVSSDSGVRLYASVVNSKGPIEAPQVLSVVRSDDGGKTWTSAVMPAELQDANLLAVDPNAPDRVLATVRYSDRADPLYLSTDGGKTFAKYGEVQEASGVTFAPDGRVFVGDAGDSAVGNRPGGVYTAAALGQPLTKVPASVPVQSDDVDCIDYDPSAKKLRVCKLNRFGELDWNTGKFTELTQIEATAGLLECEGKDIKKTCEPQLNAGPSWCCTGHYPFTAFCGDWDITSTPSGNRVNCGVSGRNADIASGRGPMINDAGTPAPPPPGAPSGTGGGELLMSVERDAP